MREAARFELHSARFEQHSARVEAIRPPAKKGRALRSSAVLRCSTDSQSSFFHIVNSSGTSTASSRFGINQGCCVFRV